MQSFLPPFSRVVYLETWGTSHTRSSDIAAVSVSQRMRISFLNIPASIFGSFFTILVKIVMDMMAYFVTYAESRVGFIGQRDCQFTRVSVITS